MSSNDSAPKQEIKLCALFPRRPKLADGGELAMKVNNVVSDVACQLSADGVPTFLGVPLVRAWHELGGDIEFRWFQLDSQKAWGADFEIEINTDIEAQCSVIRSLESKEIAVAVAASARPMSWEDALGCLRSSRRKESLEWNRWPFGPSYKPVYFMILGDFANEGVAS